MLADRWLGSAIFGRVASPTIVLANVDGGARMLRPGSSSCFLSTDTGGSKSACPVTSGLLCFLGSGDGIFWGEGLPSRDPLLSDRSDCRPSDDFCGLPLLASLSRRERAGLFRSVEDGRELSTSDGGVGVGAADFSPSFFLRAAAKAANLDTFPECSGAPPSRPNRGYRGSTSMSALRCAGMLSHGASRKKSAAEKCAVEEAGGDNGTGYTGTRKSVRTYFNFRNGVSSKQSITRGKSNTHSLRNSDRKYV